uniref:Peroxisome biogenesis protein 22 n=1 Tax=Anthurium amnicola TaxID=1678845 RepID=A0A1D1YU36_9ARAE
MADYVTEQVGSLVKRLSAHLHRKASEVVMLLFSNKGAGSLGALAGFAIAIVFTWKFLRSPPGRQRRNLPKRTNPGSSSSGINLAREVASDSEVHPSQLSLKDFNTVDADCSAVELTLGQIVRKRLNGGRKVTCQLLGVILEERTPDELQVHATVRLCEVDVLLEIAKSCDVYLMETVHDDESEERVLAALENAGLFNTGGLIKEKVLFCSTENGRSSFVRQLEPDWHIDTNPEVVYTLARFIRCQLHIAPANSSFTASNVFTSTSLEQYFSKTV